MYFGSALLCDECQSRFFSSLIIHSRDVRKPTLKPAATGRMIEEAGWAKTAAGRVKEGIWVVIVAMSCQHGQEALQGTLTVPGGLTLQPKGTPRLIPV